MKPIQFTSGKHGITGMLFILVILFSSCNPPKAEQLSLKQAFQDDFLIGAALNESQILGKDTLSAKIIETQFNSLTAENCMKWERIHPKPGVYDFTLSDRLVEYAGEHNMHLQGHVLVWHSQTPRWVFQDAAGNLTTRDTLLMRMKDHIYTVVGRYKGKVNGWDVVNEAIGDDGGFRNSLWYQIIGEDFIEKAFTFAHEADPDAELIYNDYSLPNPVKRDGVVNMVKDLQSKGIKIDGIGMQGHYHLENPPLEEIEASVEAFAALGLQVSFTEVEVTVLPVPGDDAGADISTKFEMEEWLNPYREGLPDSVQNVLAMRYKALFGLFLDHSDQIDRVTFWGVHDGVSWKNNWPVRGRTNYPLLFDRQGNPKPAFDAVIGLKSSN
jgi:endo-1,4-beta-xylanase